MLCYCNSSKDFSACCQPLLAGHKPASCAEALMRSRYSAYVTNAYSYILQTYSIQGRGSLTEAAVAADGKNTTWIRLQIVSIPSDSQVEFKAWYAHNRHLFLMHETSSFIIENGEWKYHAGIIHADTGTFKPRRNEQCICGSGKKYKQCCLSQYK